VYVYVVYGARSGETTVQIARSIASSVEWSNEYAARPAQDVNPEEIRTPAVIFLGCTSGGSELDRAIRTFLDHLTERKVYGVLWAVFDTRPDAIPKVAGSGIRRLRRAVEHRGGKLLLAPESFYTGAPNGGITHHELERARSWGANAIAVAVHQFGDPVVRSGALSGATARPAWEAWCGVPT
jgi:flavodoxin